MHELDVAKELSTVTGNRAQTVRGAVCRGLLSQVVMDVTGLKAIAQMDASRNAPETISRRSLPTREFPAMSVGRKRGRVPSGRNG